MTFDRARVDLTDVSQSRDGFCVGDVSDLDDVALPEHVAEGDASCRSPRAPTQWLPTSEWIAYAKSTGVAPCGQRLDVALRREHEDLVGEQVDLDRLQELLAGP